MGICNQVVYQHHGITKTQSHRNNTTFRKMGLTESHRTPKTRPCKTATSQVEVDDEEHGEPAAPNRARAGGRGLGKRDGAGAMGNDQKRVLGMNLGITIGGF